jgi:zinc protease
VKRRIAVASTIAALVGSAQGLGAQGLGAQGLDRARRPDVPPPKVFVLPKVQSRTLPNGLRVVVAENHALPLVAIRIVLDANQSCDPEGREGLFTLDTLMLREGTEARSAEQLSDAFDAIGVAPSPTSVTVLRRDAGQALLLIADLLIHPAFPQASLDRIGVNLAASVERNRGTPAATARRIFAATLFGAGHPFARAMSAASIAAATRNDLVQIHARYVRPQNATLVVVGDASTSDVFALAERAFGGWERGGEHVPATGQALPAPEPTTIYIVDRPGAAQSTMFVGQAGPPRTVADAAALETMGAVLGGQSGSRLGQNLRERNHYTYGALANVVWRRLTEPSGIYGSSNVERAKTDSALTQWLAELRDIRGSRPPTEREMEFARNGLVASLPAQIETIDLTANRLAQMVRDGLPFDFYDRFAAEVLSMTPEAVVAAAVKYVDPAHTAIVIVGDRARIEAGLAAARIGPIVRVDTGGKPLK